MIKKILIGLVIFICGIYFVIYNTDVLAKDDNKVFEEIEEAIYISEFNTCQIIDEDVYVLNGKTYFTKYDKVIDGTLISYFEKDQFLYMLYKQNYKYCIEKFSSLLGNSSYLYYNEKLTKIIYHNDLIYVIGNMNDDASLYIYDLDLQQISKYYYGGDAYETFNDIYFFNDCIYLVGLKNGISHNSDFANSGNASDLKTFIVKLDNDYKINNAFYINEQTKEETVVNVYFIKDKIYILLKDYNYKYYQYVLGLNLEIYEKYMVTNYVAANSLYLVKSFNIENEKIYLYIDNNNLYYGVFTNKLIYQSILKNDVDKVLYATIKEGKLIVYYKLNNQVYKQKISMYLEEEINEKVVHYNDNSYYDTSHFKVKSYFTPLDFEYNESNEISFNKSGVYNAKYTAKISDDYSITITTPYRVLPFINVINEGIYNKGYKLEFSDNLYIDERRIYNGEALDTEGTYHLTHITSTDTYHYTIYIISDYYKDFTSNTEFADVELLKGDKYVYNINLSSEKIVKKIIVNGKDFPFKQVHNKIILVFDETLQVGVKSYSIDYIEFNDGSIYEISEEIRIKVIKELPKINIYTENQKIIYDVFDIDKSITDIVVKYYNGETQVATDKTYLKDYQVGFLSSYSKVEVVMVYEDLRGTTYETLLFSLSGRSKKDTNLFELKFIFDNEVIDKIKIENINTSRLELTDASIKELSVTNELKIEKNTTFIYIIIGSTTLFIVISVFIYISTKKTTKRVE